MRPAGQASGEEGLRRAIRVSKAIPNFVDLRVEHDLKLVVLHGNSAANIQVDSVNASEWTPVVPCERDGLRDQGRKHVAHRRAMRGDRASRTPD